MDFSSPLARRLGAVGFGAAVPAVLLGCILVIGNHPDGPVTSDDVGPGPVPSATSTDVGGVQQSLPPVGGGPVDSRDVQSGPPTVSDFQTDSNSGYASGLQSVDLFACQPVITKPKGGGKPVSVVPDKCKSRPKGQ